jgi:hypothetical protein
LTFRKILLKFSLLMVAFILLLGMNIVYNNGNSYALQKPSDFSFIAAGDWGCDEKAQNTARNMENKTPDLALALGDLSYQKNADCWLDMMNPLLNRTTIAIGITSIISKTVQD